MKVNSIFIDFHNYGQYNVAKLHNYLPNRNCIPPTGVQKYTSLQKRNSHVGTLL